jgi:hypothetical protein
MGRHLVNKYDYLPTTKTSEKKLAPLQGTHGNDRKELRKC